MNTLIIDAELKNLLPPLSEEEAAGLEESILKEGCLSPLIVWGNVLVDGHYRYAICAKHAIPFSVKKIHFANMEEAKLWAWQHQNHRRNLTPFLRAELALKFKDIIARKAKEHQRLAGGRNGNRIPGEPINTASELAKIAGVSHGSLYKAGYIASQADEEAKNRLRRGDTSIHREYKRLKSDNTNVPALNEPVASSETQITAKTDSGLLCWHKDTPPEEWMTFLMDTYPIEYVCGLIRGFLNQYNSRCGKEATQHFLLKTCAEWID